MYNKWIPFSYSLYVLYPYIFVLIVLVFAFCPYWTTHKHKYPCSRRDSNPLLNTRTAADLHLRQNCQRDWLRTLIVKEYCPILSYVYVCKSAIVVVIISACCKCQLLSSNCDFFRNIYCRYVQVILISKNIHICCQLR
jgi:hypothetical protein